jgi:hypothetical protein
LISNEILDEQDAATQHEELEVTFGPGDDEAPFGPAL